MNIKTDGSLFCGGCGQLNTIVVEPDGQRWQYNVDASAAPVDRHVCNQSGGRR